MKFPICVAVFLIVWAILFFYVPVRKLIGMPEVATKLMLFAWAIISFGVAVIAAATVWRALK